MNVGKAVGIIITVIVVVFLSIGFVQFGWFSALTNFSFQSNETTTLIPTITSTPRPTVPSSIEPEPTLEINVPITLPPCRLGESVEIKLSLKNTGSKPINLSYYPPEIKISQQVNEEVVRRFPKGNKTIKIEPNKKHVYIFKWDQKDEGGNQVEPGYYTADVYNIHADGPELRHTGTIFAYGFPITRVLIQQPQGAMEKIIEVNQSKKVNNIT